MRRVSCDGLLGLLGRSLSSANTAGSTTKSQIPALSTWLLEKVNSWSTTMPLERGFNCITGIGASQLKPDPEDMSCALIMSIRYLLDVIAR